ncbi:MAG: asparagine synthase (glutamine-hydrolyzing) [Gemmatimonadaceae bacterium]
MCGIAGIVGAIERDSAARAIRAATSCIAHRGPDADGFHEDSHAALGFRRLSILDTNERANQPMYSPERTAIIVYNGEIYNFEELKDELSARGERFATTGDTEVILRLLARDGVGALPKIAGMFAIALWKPAQRELLLVRDRFGEKPLHIAQMGSTLAFASEIPALLQFPGISRRIDYEALGYFFETGFVPAPLTMFAGVRSLLPGQWLRWRDGEITTGSYYQVEVEPDPRLDDLDAAADAVRSALSAAVKRQMISDVPLGAFLSGGIDSSSIVALMQQHSSAPVKTFNVRFSDAKYDESAIARRVAEHVGTEHHELTVEDASFHEDDLWRIIDHVGSPFHDSSAIPTFIVSKYARQFVTVVLSGDGGDEMFAGYPAFQWGARVESLSRVPAPALSLGAALARTASRLPGLTGSSRLRQGAKGLAIATLPTESQRFRAIHRLFSPADFERLLVPQAVAAAHRPRGDLLTELPPVARRWSPLRRMMYTRMRQELAGDMLVKVDRMSMATSLETRAPFLDPLVAAVSGRIPDQLLISGATGKHVLRHAMRNDLPAEVFSHPKWGFSIPLHRFFNDEYRRVTQELLAPSGPLRRIVHQRELDAVISRGLSRTRDAADISVYQATHQLWAILQLAAWVQRLKVQL